jgi:hypothetical protein
MKSILIAAIFTLLIALNSQSGFAQIQSSPGFAGLGMGLPYGGIGGRLGYTIADQYDLFLGIGYNFTSLASNAGFQYQLPIGGHVSPYALAMYGANASVKIENLEDYNETFLGPSFGLGAKIYLSKNHARFWDINLVLPLRSKDYEKTISALKHDFRVEKFKEPNPVLISIGYNFSLY